MRKGGRKDVPKKASMNVRKDGRKDVRTYYRKDVRVSVSLDWEG